MKRALFLLVLLSANLLSVAQTNKSTAELIREGMELQDIKKNAEAIARYEQVSETDSNYSLAVLQLARAYRETKNYEKATEVLKKGINLHSEGDHVFYDLLGKICTERDSFSLSVKYLDEGISRFPNYYLLPYTKGIALLNMNRDKEAFEAFKKATELNYYHTESHIQLGNLAFKYGMITPALLSYQFALILQPSGEGSADVLSNLFKLLRGEDIKAEDKSKFMPYQAGENDFEDIDLIISSKAALDPKFKSQSKIENTLPNQLQLLCEKLAEKGEDSGFFMESYGWFFKKLYAQDYFAGMTYLIFSGLNNYGFRQTIAANQSKKEKFRMYAVDELMRYRSARPLLHEGTSYVMKRYFNEDGSMDVMGEMSVKLKDVRVGKWFLFGPNGNVSAKKEFDEQGRRTGTWYWYYANGKLKEEINYKEDRQHGASIKYDQNGNVTERKNFVYGEETK